MVIKGSGLKGPAPIRGKGWICSSIKRKGRGLVHVNVIRVPIAANRIEGDHHVRS